MTLHPEQSSRNSRLLKRLSAIAVASDLSSRCGEKTRGRFEMSVSDSVVRVGPTRLREKSSVDTKGLAADKRSAVAQKKFHGRGDIFRRTDAAQRREARPGFCEIGELSFGSFRFDCAWSNAIHANAEWTQLQRRGFRKHFDATLAG